MTAHADQTGPHPHVAVESLPTQDATDADYRRHPKEWADTYSASGVWGTRRIDEVLLPSSPSVERAQRPAVTAAGRTVTHAELSHLVGCVADDLRASGLARGTRMVLQLPNGLDLIAVTLAAFRIGAVPVFALPAHRAVEITHLARTSDATVYLLGELPGLDLTARRELVERIEADLPELLTIDWANGRTLRLRDATGSPNTTDNATGDAADLAFFQVSGGTTGPSKLIPRAHREYVYSFMQSTVVCGFDEATVLLPAIPLAHNFAMSSPGWMGAIAAGGHVVIPSASDVRTIATEISEHAVTHIQTVPPLLHDWLSDDDFPRQSVRRILVGGAHFSEHLARRVIRELAPVQQVYGMAEGLVCYTALDADEDTIATTQGKPMSPDDVLRIVGPDGAEVPDGRAGELHTRGPYTIPAYYRASRDSFTIDGFYRTGDLVERTADGNLRVVGRVKEQINRGGEKVAPAEVESLIATHPAVAQVCVRGAVDEFLGERVEAYVVPVSDADSIDARDLRRHLRASSLASFKIPAVFHFVDVLPTTAVGKFDRRNLSAPNEASARPPAATAAQSHGTASGRSVESGVHADHDRSSDADDVTPDLDVLGIGFGPANMAVAAALGELDDSSALNAQFFEAADSPNWHAGMLLSEATLQVSFAKDLVTFRNPRSEFSFLNFLVERGRIHDFFNRGSSAPLRVEFAEYLRWAAKRLDQFVTYGHRVTSVEPILRHGSIVAYRVGVSHGGENSSLIARHVVAAGGLTPSIPAAFGTHDRLFHSAEYLTRVPSIELNVACEYPQHLVVIGGGQSAAEVTLDLRSRFPTALVHLVHSRFGLIPSDATPFANRIFDHESVGQVFSAPEHIRERLAEVHRNTNYSVVHEDTLQELYDAIYADSWSERRRIQIHDVSRIVSIESIEPVEPRQLVDGETKQRAGGSGPLRVRIDHELDGSTAVVTAEIVIAATGYRAFDPTTLMEHGSALIERDADHRVSYDRDYSVRWSVPSTAHFFALGASGHQHGISSTLLSGIALRAGEVVEAIQTADARRTLDAPLTTEQRT